MLDAVPAPPSTRQPTTSELVYVIAGPDAGPGQLPPSATELAARLRAAESGIAGQTLAAALWELRRAGAISLEVRKSKALGFIPKTEVIATALQPASPQGGIEAELLAVIARKSPRSVDAVVGDWYGKKAAVSPQHVVVGRIRGHLEASGLLDRRTVDADRNAVTGFLRGQTKEVVTLDGQALLAAGPRLAEVASAWLEFERSEPELARELVARVEKAIDRKEMSDSDSGGGMDFD